MKVAIATRKSPLALAQAELVAKSLRANYSAACKFIKIASMGDRKQDWSLQKEGGKGLFTAELESSLLQGEADIAVHSAKDLPGKMPDGLAIAGYLPRNLPCDVLVCRRGVTTPALIATGSPRRRHQLKILFPNAEFTEIRGNVDTRLKKIASGLADATVLAAAGLARLGIRTWPGLTFRILSTDEMIPAVGQAAIAIQCRTDDVPRFRLCYDSATSRSVGFERAIQGALGAGCHTATAAHIWRNTLHLYHEHLGARVIELSNTSFETPSEAAAKLMRELLLVQ